MTPDQVKGNRLFLVCTVCGPEIEYSLELARRKNAGYEKVMQHRLVEDWFERHANCGDTRDHFKLGMERNPDWDKGVVVKPDSHVGAHVRLALIKSDRVKI
jgi:hypothetical protein